jgi:hypothetical protein
MPQTVERVALEPERVVTRRRPEHVEPSYEDEPDFVEELKKIGRAFKQETGLTADQAAAHILSEIRRRRR